MLDRSSSYGFKNVLKKSDFVRFRSDKSDSGFSFYLVFIMLFALISFASLGVIGIVGSGKNILFNSVVVNGSEMIKLDLRAYFYNIKNYFEFVNNKYGQFALLDSLVVPISNIANFSDFLSGLKSVVNILIVLINAILKPLGLLMQVVNFVCVILGYSYTYISESFLVFQIPYLE